MKAYQLYAGLILYLFVLFNFFVILLPIDQSLAMEYWMRSFFGLGGGLIIWTHLIQSLMICMSNLKLFLSVCHLFLCSNKAHVPSCCPICSFLISHPEEYGLLWPTLEWSCSDTTFYDKRFMFFSAGCHYPADDRKSPVASWMVNPWVAAAVHH